MATKANLKELPIEHYAITTSEVVQYLQDQLGFAFDCDFALWDNRAEWEKPSVTHKCFVIMRAVFRREDITVQDSTTDYVGQVMKATGAGMNFKDTVIKTLRPFMFPANMSSVRQRPDVQARLAEQGIAGSRLEELMRRPGLFYDQTNDRFGLYLRPERIIYDMLCDPGTNSLNGTMAFGYVSDSKNAEAIRWGVNVYHNSVMSSPSGVSIDAVFNSIK